MFFFLLVFMLHNLIPLCIYNNRDVKEERFYVGFVNCQGYIIYARGALDK